MSFFGTGFVPLRRGIMEHVFDGRLTATEHHALVSMLPLANAATAIWIGSAPALTTVLGYTSKNTMAESLDGLEAKGYILRDFAPGRRGNFPILIDKFQLTRGSHSGMRVDLAATKRKYGIPEGRLGKLTRKALLSAISAACKEPVFDSETDDGVDEGHERGADRGVRSSIVSRSERGDESEGGGSEASAHTPDFISGFAEGQEELSGSLFQPELEAERSAPVHVQAHSPVVLPVKPVTPTAFSAAPTPQMSAPEQLATQFFGYQGRPVRWNNPATFELWVSTFHRLVQTYGFDDLLGAMRWSFETDSFWPQHLVRASGDPLAYFETKLAKQLMPRYLGWKASEANTVKGKKYFRKESSDDKQHRPSASRTGKQAVDNAGAAEEAKRRIAERFGC